MKKQLHFFSILFFVIQYGFSQSIDSFIDTSIEVDSLNVPVNTKQHYFPKEMFPEVIVDWIETEDGIKTKFKIKEGSYDDFVMSWYSKHLHTMKEPLLFNKKINKEVYRFTWLRTFHKPMTFRFEKRDDIYILYWKVLSGAGGYDPGKLETQRIKVLTKKEWDTFITLIKKANFWEMSLSRKSIGYDGSEWIMEGANTKNYRVVSVWSPNKGDFYNACNYLITISGVQIADKNKY
ncbi:hypothetical protein [uncultured Dokdonia sp.]|uniref:hypothetical protein n=1 Tax=uncultured Dokdonia sp. TaxID=575653 RepID=UPI0026341EB8|nr:hypothetical protein [uncultured Dokdonia sp.]